MGQIKNIKLHIVTDIKTQTQRRSYTELVSRHTKRWIVFTCNEVATAEKTSIPISTGIVQIEATADMMIFIQTGVTDAPDPGQIEAQVDATIPTNHGTIVVVGDHQEPATNVEAIPTLDMLQTRKEGGIHIRKTIKRTPKSLKRLSPTSLMTRSLFQIR